MENSQSGGQLALIVRFHRGNRLLARFSSTIHEALVVHLFDPAVAYTYCDDIWPIVAAEGAKAEEECGSASVHSKKQVKI